MRIVPTCERCNLPIETGNDAVGTENGFICQRCFASEPKTDVKQDSSTKLDTGTKLESNTKPDASKKPDTSTKPDISTEPDIGATPHTKTKPGSSAKADTSAKPDTDIKRDTRTKSNINARPEINGNADSKAPELTKLVDVEAPPSKTVDQDVPADYEILEALSECQHGRAYRVHDEKLNAKFILRFVTAGVARMTGGLPIESVGRLLTQLNNPHLLTVYEWRTSAKNNYLVIDNPPEKSIETIIAKEGFFDLPRAIDIFIQVCEALEDLHKHNLVHGHIRPRTICLVPTDSKIDSVKVIACGITNFYRNNLEQPLKIGRNYTCNDAFYMNPEELRGALPTVSGDIYSLGCVVFHAITGKPLYRARTEKEVEAQHLDSSRAEFKKRYEIPPNVEQVVLHMLEKDPQKRYRTIKAVREDLERIRDDKQPILEDRWRHFLSWFGG